MAPLTKLANSSSKTTSVSLKGPDEPNITTSIASGFTIVELLIVIAIIGILAAVTIVSYVGISQKAVASSLQADLKGATTKLKLYQADNMAYPTSLDCATTPAANTICLTASPGNSYSYTVVNTTSPQTFSLTATNTNSVTYVVTNDSTPVATAPPINYSYAFVSGSVTPTVYKNTNSIYLYNATTYAPRNTPGSGVSARITVPTGTVRFMIQSAGGGGPADDGDGAAPGYSGALAYFETANLAGKTLEFHYGYKTSGAGAGQWTPLAHPDRQLDNPNISRGPTATMGGYGGVGSTDCLIYNVTDNYLVAHVEGGTGSINYDNPPGRIAYSYIAPSTRFTTTAIYSANGNIGAGSMTNGPPGPSPWQNNQNSVRAQFTAPASTVNTAAGTGGPVGSYVPQSALMIMEKM